MIVLILASAILPNIIAMERGQRERAFLSDLVRLPKQARTLAMETGENQTVIFDSATRTFQVENSQFRAEIPFDAIQVTSLRRQEEDLSESDWQIRCTPEGRCDPGGIQLNLNERLIAIQIDRSGAVQEGEGELPPPVEETWPTGDFEIRGNAAGN